MAFERIDPILRVADLAASLDYYVRILGFKIDWTYDGLIASVSRDGCVLMLSQGDQGHTGTWVWIGVEDCAAIHDELRASGAKIRNPPQNFPWALEMQVEDPDGNVLRIGSESIAGAPFGRWRDMNGTLWQLAGDGWSRIAE